MRGFASLQRKIAHAACVAPAIAAAVACCVRPALADQATFGATLDPLFGTHAEGGGRTEFGGVPIATLEGSYRHGALEVYAEGLPPFVSIPSYGTLGRLDTTLAFVFVAVRAYDPTGHVSLGIGLTRFTNDTTYVRFSERDRSHLSGLRYEFHVDVPLSRGSLEASAIASPSLPGGIDRSYAAAGRTYHDGTTESGADVEAIGRYVLPSGPGDVLLGARYINFAARFPDGSQADRNRGVAIVLGYRFRLAP